MTGITCDNTTYTWNGDILGWQERREHSGEALWHFYEIFLDNLTITDASRVGYEHSIKFLPIIFQKLFNVCRFQISVSLV